MLLNHDVSWVYGLQLLEGGALELNRKGMLHTLILQHILNAFEARTGSLALLDGERRNLDIVAAIGLPDEVIGKIIPVGSGVMGWVAGEGNPLLLNGDVSSDPRFTNYRRRENNHTPNSAICWPLKSGTRVIGAISLNRLAQDPLFTAADLAEGSMLLNLLGVFLENIEMRIRQEEHVAKLEEANRKLEEVHGQLLQSEKMASIGQLAAGVAHEINNPIGYVYSNVGSLEKYLKDLFEVINAYEQAEAGLNDAGMLEAIRAVKVKADLEFLREDMQALLAESKEGITRVKKIVQDLKDFSHVDAADEWHWADLRTGLDTTLNIVWNEIKYKAEVKKEYGDIPEIECLPSQLNQVFMNLLVNAAHAIEERGVITIRTGTEGEGVWVEIADSGKGIAPEHLNRIFDPFFTTKPIGKGTGLGLSLAYGIVQKHHGRIEVQSEVGRGTTFRVWLPLRQPDTGQAQLRSAAA